MYKKKELKLEKNEFINITLDDITKLSNEQYLMNKEYLLNAYLFSLNTTNEYDRNLIEFVRSHIDKPSKLPLNLSDKTRTDFSQIGQSKFINSALYSIRNGFFIEAGGLDGEAFSVIKKISL